MSTPLFLIRQSLKEKEPFFGSWQLVDDEKGGYIGSGNFGHVFLIEKSDTTGKYVAALKYIPLMIKLDSNVKRSLRDKGLNTTEHMMVFLEDSAKKQAEEIQILYQLRGSANIVSYLNHDIIVKKEGESLSLEILLGMEYLPQSLIGLIEKVETKGLPMDQVLSIAGGIGQGLAVAHKKGIIHRDLKPENILLTADGEPKIADFGVAKMHRNATLGRGGTYTGSPLYMAPEVHETEIHPDKSYDHRADIYSFGLIIYEMLKGSYPFFKETGDELKALQMRLSGESFPAIGRTDVPEYVEKAVAKACASDPNERFQSVEEFIEALHKKPESQQIPIANLGIAQKAESQQIPITNFGKAKKSEQSKKSTFTIVAIVAAFLLFGGIAWALSGTVFSNNKDLPAVVGSDTFTVAQELCKWLEETRAPNIKSDMETYQKALDLFTKKQYDQAIPNFNKLISIDSRDALSSILRENCRLMINNQPFIKIAVASPLTGDQNQRGFNVILGAALAQEEINNSGGVMGKKIYIQLADDHGESSQAVNVAKQLAGDTKILAVIGHIRSSETLAAAPEYEKAGIVEVSPSSSAMALSGISKYFFRVCPDDKTQGKVLVDGASKNGIKSAVIIYNPTDQHSMDLAQAIKKEMAAISLVNRAELMFEDGKTNFSDIAAEIEKSKPDAIFFTGKDQEGAYFLIEMSKKDNRIPIITGDAMYTLKLLNTAGNSANNMITAAFYHAKAGMPWQKQFTDNFLQRYDGGTPNERCSLTYDAIFVIRKALERSQEITREGVLKGIKGVSFTGSSGPIKFDENGAVPNKPVVILKVIDGQFSPIEVF